MKHGFCHVFPCADQPADGREKLDSRKVGLGKTKQKTAYACNEYDDGRKENLLDSIVAANSLFEIIRQVGMIVGKPDIGTDGCGQFALFSMMPERCELKDEQNKEKRCRYIADRFLMCFDLLKHIVPPE